MYCENIVDETLLYESLLEKVVKNYPHGNDDVDITVLENVFPTASVFFQIKLRIYCRTYYTVFVSSYFLTRIKQE
jgi:hypothetical protein